MTKYILNSGGLKNNPEKAISFNREMVRGLGENPTILFCYFAVAREDWEEKFIIRTKSFLESMDKNINPKFDLAFPDKFINQVKNSDVILINGGDDNLLLYWLKKYNLPEIWKGKVVVGSSAGSNALVKHFWTCDWRMVMSGLGILPIKFISHFNSLYGKDNPQGPINWKNAQKELEDYGEKSLPIYPLEEGDFIIIEQ